MDSGDRITQLLQDVDDERDGAMDRLMDAVYADLRAVARHHMAQRFGHDLPGVTLEPSALVNESFMRLIRQRTQYQNRQHFFAIATRVMLRVLVDYQRERRAAKRGGGKVGRLTLSLGEPAAPGETDDDHPSLAMEIEPLVAALDRLEELDRRKADVVRLRVVWGLEMREIGRTLDVSIATVERDWAFAKAWLAREVGDEPPTEEGPGD